MNISPLPITDYAQTHFITHLSLSVHWTTIRSYLSALRFFQIRAGLPDPSLTPSPKIPYLLKGIHKLTPDHKRTTRHPITPDIMRNIHHLWSQQPTTFNETMLWAAFCLAFFGFMRAGELTASTAGNQANLQVNDITVDSHVNPQLLTIHLRHSKTDQFGAGHYIHLGRTSSIVCPVAAMLGYLSHRPTLGTQTNLFIFENGDPLTRPKLVSHLRQAITLVGLDPKAFSGHSFRIGAASTAAAVGLNDSTIQQAGRWKSNTFRTYIRKQATQQAAISNTLIS